MGEGQLYSLADLLLLDVEATNVGVRDVRPLGIREQGDGGVRLWGQGIDDRVGVAVEGDRGAVRGRVRVVVWCGVVWW